MPPENAHINSKMEAFAGLLEKPQAFDPKQKLYAGVDLGTANIVTAVVDEAGRPVVGVSTHSRSTVRDGLVLDYMGAIKILRQQVESLRGLGFNLELAAAAYPPGTSGRDAQSFGNVLQAVDLEVAGLTDEPSAASLALEIERGCVVDIGGGTTGISLLENKEVVYSADEATGGHHLDLVIAGNYGMDVEQAEKLKNDPSRQGEVAPLVRPVFQKMASIVRQHLGAGRKETLYLVGGTCSFPGVVEIMKTETGLEVILPSHPLLVTPLGIALHCLCAATGKTNPAWSDLQ